MAKIAMIAGATGLVGNLLLKLMIDDNDYSSIIALTRRPLELKHNKIKEVICDLNTLEENKDLLKADTVFCCLGTTQKKAGSKEAFKKVDHDYPVKLAELAKANGATSYLLITAFGANINSSNFYNKVKGETEEDIANIGIDTLHILQPSLISGPRKEFRFFESLANMIAPLVNPFLIGSLKKYRTIEAQQVALAMLKISKNVEKGVFRHMNDVLLKY